MKRRNRTTRIRFPVYGYEVRVIFSRDLVATARRLGEKEDISSAAAALVTFDEQPSVGWLLLPPKPGTDIIAHEAGHAIYAMARTAGTTLDEETFCHHLGHLVWSIHKFLKQRV
jgi:hypothetical protein